MLATFTPPRPPFTFSNQTLSNSFKRNKGFIGSRQTHKNYKKLNNSKKFVPNYVQSKTPFPSDKLSSNSKSSTSTSFDNYNTPEMELYSELNQAPFFNVNLKPDEFNEDYNLGSISLEESKARANYYIQASMQEKPVYEIKPLNKDEIVPHEKITGLMVHFEHCPPIAFDETTTLQFYLFDSLVDTVTHENTPIVLITKNYLKEIYPEELKGKYSKTLQLLFETQKKYNKK